MLGSYTHKFLKCGAALLTDLPELCLRLPSCVCNSKAEQEWKGFRKRMSFLKTRTVWWVGGGWGGEGSDSVHFRTCRKHICADHKSESLEPSPDGLRAHVVGDNQEHWS